MGQCVNSFQRKQVCVIHFNADSNVKECESQYMDINIQFVKMYTFLETMKMYELN